MPRNAEPTGDPKGHEPTPPDLRIKPFEIAALATAMWIFRGLEKSSHLGGFPPKSHPEDFLDRAQALLTQSKGLLARAFADETADAAYERQRAEDPYECSKSYSWKEVLRKQTEPPKDGGAASKFLLGKEWSTLASKAASGAFRFTNKDLLNRPAGYSMIGTITTEKGLRNAVNRLIPEIAGVTITSKTLSLYQINVILIDQLTRNRGNIPVPRRVKTAPQ